MIINVGLKWITLVNVPWLSWLQGSFKKDVHLNHRGYFRAEKGEWIHPIEMGSRGHDSNGMGRQIPRSRTYQRRWQLWLTQSCTYICTKLTHIPNYFMKCNPISFPHLSPRNVDPPILSFAPRVLCRRSCPRAEGWYRTRRHGHIQHGSDRADLRPHGVGWRLSPGYADTMII